MKFKCVNVFEIYANAFRETKIMEDRVEVRGFHDTDIPITPSVKINWPEKKFTINSDLGKIYDSGWYDYEKEFKRLNPQVGGGE